MCFYMYVVYNGYIHRVDVVSVVFKLLCYYLNLFLLKLGMAVCGRMENIFSRSGKHQIISDKTNSQ